MTSSIQTVPSLQLFSSANNFTIMNTQQTAPTLYVEVHGIKFAYRSFGASSEVPLIFFQHFIGNIDDWDPAVTNEFAKTRRVILFNNTGVASTNGNTPDNVALVPAVITNECTGYENN